MSYELVKSISIKDSKVVVTSASNNVYPHTYEVWTSEELTNVLNKNGIKECEIEILKLYEEGSFQGGQNKYTKALKRLLSYPEYDENFNWRKSSMDINDPINVNRKTKKEEFENLLKKVLY